MPGVMRKSYRGSKSNALLYSDLNQMRFRRYHFGHQRLRRNILLVRPRNRAEHDADAIEVMHIPKLAKHAMIKIRRQVENPLSAILDFDIDTMVGQGLDGFDIPVHDRPKLELPLP